MTGHSMRTGMLLLCVANMVELTGCGGGGAAQVPQSARVVLGSSVAYVGTTNACVLPGAANCLRAPAAPGGFVSVAQSGNLATFNVTSADPSIATGVVVMQGPSGQGEPAVELIGEKAGTTTLTITGINGASASLPVTVTTMATLSVHLNNLPTVTNITFTVNAAASATCPGFEGGYTLFFGPITSPTVVLENFPAMGDGELAQCTFTTIEAVATDASGATVVDKVSHIGITVGLDNSATLTLP